ncbi:MAG: hypothetical protein K2X73_01200 [Sphingomonas sp.]|uniref:hypothetical protein n=1 Tax=Sphingomonas sp. TaxID=28214 RepID=UPI0025E809D1|nr:hypothetical protein [Sphingomonas sp.]MBX9880568.1 hypothetical protein [Sphingomonas sp.]
MRLLILAALPLIAATPECPPGTPSSALPPRGWRAPVTVAAGQTAEAAPAIAVNQPARVGLAPGAALRFALPPERAPDPASRGGTVAVEVAKPGRYSVGLGTSAWIDVVRDGAALPAIAHGHGASCWGLRKLVTFDLSPGRYLIQLSGAKVETTTLVVIPAR